LRGGSQARFALLTHKLCGRNKAMITRVLLATLVVKSLNHLVDEHVV